MDGLPISIFILYNSTDPVALKRLASSFDASWNLSQYGLVFFIGSIVSTMYVLLLFAHSKLISTLT